MSSLEGLPGAQGEMGLLGLSLVIGGVSNVSKQDSDQLESRSISPQVSRKSNDLMTIYEVKEELPVTRFLINNPIKDNLDSEMEVFNRAIAHLSIVKSAAEVILESTEIPRLYKESNVVLVDIFDISDNQSVAQKFHTVCLWKKTNQNLLIIDPSNCTFSERLLEPLRQKHGFTIDAKKPVGNKFYESFQKDTGGASMNQDGTNVNKDNRDCIDIAVKIAFSLNLSQRVACDLFTVESRIDYLSNQRKVNTALLQGGMEERIGWLQNSNANQREETVRLLFENKEYIAMVEVADIQALQKLNYMRLSVVKFSDGDLGQEDFIKLIKESKPNNSKLTLDQFSIYLKDWTNILQKESESKKLKDQIKDQIKDQSSKLSKGGKSHDK